MHNESRRVGIRRLVEAINTQDVDAFGAIYHDDLVVEWPQSGEVIRGKHNIRELRLARPTAQPTATCAALSVRVTLWATEMIFDYDGDRYCTVLIHEYRDGLVVRETCYFGGAVRGARVAGSVGGASTECRGGELIRALDTAIKPAS
jgi:hypothetical protein